MTHNRMHCESCPRVCGNPANGIAGCSKGKCVIGGCHTGWDDCNHNPDDGCEQKIFTDEHCLGCYLPCAEGTHCDRGVCL